MCSAFSIPGVTLEGLRLYLFSYTLRDEAKRRAQSLEPDEINAWDQLVERQLVKSCSYIGIPDCILMETFYNGLDQPTQVVVDASAGEGLMDRSYTEAKSILDCISRNSDEWLDTGLEERGLEQERAEGVVVPTDTMNTLIDQMTTMTSLLQTMANQQRHLSHESAQVNALTHVAAMNCVQCGEGHLAEVYPWNQQFVYSIYNDPFGNTYNPGWQNHLTFSWDENHNQGSQSDHQNNYQGNRGNPPVFINQDHSSGNFQIIQPYDQPFFSDSSYSTSSLETLLKHYIENSEAIRQSHASSLRVLEEQVEQLAIELKNKTHGMLPSSSGVSEPRDKEQCQAVTLRSGKTTVPVPPVPDSMSRPVDLTTTMTSQPLMTESPIQNALFQNNIPTKMKDPGSFTLLCSIGGKKVGNALCDLGASINLMPLSIFKKLNIGNARPTTITLQLANRSIMHPEGKIEDVLLQVDKFIFLVDFIILDYEADREVPIILGHSFLATGCWTDLLGMNSSNFLTDTQGKTKLQLRWRIKIRQPSRAHLARLHSIVCRLDSTMHQIARPLSVLLEAGHEYDFVDAYTEAFHTLKDALITAPILITPNWTPPFALMCDASGYAVGTVLSQRKDKEKEKDIEERFPDELLMLVGINVQWYADIVNFIVCSQVPEDYTYQ
ncbi:uncharacterized protein LOC120077408 [Benincasa hispida]|uniref:uncharacterized protein LOC120077408 n=1 Tax=Benincasa hispida TaxID=102211 RepID=UPI0019008CAD|nr:uncharacterized protein LOC120077408 [Benincasa hispida]